MVSFSIPAFALAAHRIEGEKQRQQSQDDGDHDGQINLRKDGEILVAAVLALGLRVLDIDAHPIVGAQTPLKPAVEYAERLGGTINGGTKERIDPRLGNRVARQL
jgi:hypothetical protein